MSQWQGKTSQFLLNLQKLIIIVLDFAKDFTFCANLTNSRTQCLLTRNENSPQFAGCFVDAGGRQNQAFTALTLTGTDLGALRLRVLPLAAQAS